MSFIRDIYYDIIAKLANPIAERLAKPFIDSYIQEFKSIELELHQEIQAKRKLENKIISQCEVLFEAKEALKQFATQKPIVESFLVIKKIEGAIDGYFITSTADEKNLKEELNIKNNELLNLKKELNDQTVSLARLQRAYNVYHKLLGGINIEDFVAAKNVVAEIKVFELEEKHVGPNSKR